jgi:histidinol phosphatase-like enzyme
MKIIFLDIDGVLNHQEWYSYQQKQPKLTDENWEKGQFCYWSINLLNDLIKDTGAKVVVSSSWRKGKSVECMQTLLDSVGFEGEVIGITPCLYFSNQDYNYSVPRGCEIKAWIEMNKSILNEKVSKLKYVILDDDSDMMYWQRNKFIHVNPHCGITKRDIFQAKQILNS